MGDTGPAVSMKDSKRVLIGLIVGLGLGVLAGTVNDTAAETVAGWVEPVGILWSNAIRLMVIPLVLACVFTAVVSSGNRGTFGRMGLVVAIAAVVILGVSTAAGLGLGRAVLDGVPIEGGSLDRLRERYAGSAPQALPPTSLKDWLVQLIPVNPFKALADGSVLPLIVGTILLAGAAKSMTAAKRLPLEQLSTAITDLAFVWIRLVLRLAPIGVFALIFAISVRAGSGMAVALLYYVLLTSALYVVVAIGLYLVARLFGAIPLRRFARAALTPQIIGFTSRSSLAALPAMIDVSEKQLGLPAEVSRAFLPLLVSLFRVTGGIASATAVVFASWLYGAPLRGDQLLTVGLLSVVVSVGMPAIPGGGIFASAPVLAAVGLPVEAIGILLAVDPISDMFRTGTNITAHLSLSALAARVVPSGVRTG